MDKPHKTKGSKLIGGDGERNLKYLARASKLDILHVEQQQP
jgi:hypothetical protein